MQDIIKKKRFSLACGPRSPALKAIGLSVMLLTAHGAYACINGYEPTVNELIHNGDPQQIALAVARLENDYKLEPTAHIANDLAVVQVLSGNAQRAIEVLTQLEHDAPGLSKTASNLGTALELAGRNAEALVWIKEGIKRDPKDHEGTEWLHVKILEAKTALASDANWLSTHSVLGLNFGLQDMPQTPSRGTVDYLGTAHTLADAQRAIAYQLHERLRFVARPDPVVADLYFAQGNIDTVLNAGRPKDDYDQAIGFGAVDVATIQRRISYVESHPFGISIVVWVALLLALCVAFAAILWPRKRPSSLQAAQ